MKRKTGLISYIIISMIIMCITAKVYANTSRIGTSIQQNEMDDNKIQIEVAISDIENIGEGINAYSGVLNFNVEELTLLEVKGGENWNTPTYNEKTVNGGITKVVCTSNQFNNSEGTLFVAVFEKKVQKQNYDVEFTEFEAAAKVNGETIKVSENTQEENSNNIAQSNEDMENLDQRNIVDKTTGIALCIIVIVLIVIFVLVFHLYRKNKGRK